MSKMKDLIIDPIDLQSMSIEDLKLLKLRLVGKALTKFPSSPRQFKVRAEIDKVWNELNRRRGLDNNMTKENEDSQRSKSVLRKSSRIIRLPGDNSRDAEAPKPWSKAESLMRLLTERLPSGFSIENWNLEISDEMFTFAVSIPSSASKSIIPPEGNTVYIGGSGTFEAYFDREEGWDISVDFNEKSLVFLDENDKEVKIDSKQIRGVIKVLDKHFGSEFRERIKDELEESRTAYRGEAMEGERTPIPKELQHLHWTDLQRLWNPKTKRYDYDKERPSPELTAIRAKGK